MTLSKFLSKFPRSGNGWVANTQSYRLEFRADGCVWHSIDFQSLAGNPPATWGSFMETLIRRRMTVNEGDFL